MTDEIKPALTPEEWESLTTRGTLPAYLEEIIGSRANLLAASSAATMAVANHALPHDDPRKITRAKVRALDAIISVSEDHWDEGPSDEGWQSDELSDSVAMARQLRDAIAALLPPEPL